MKKLLLASCAILPFVAGAPQAMAGDLRLAPSTYDWGGGYVGMNTGAALDATKFSSNYVYTGTSDLDPDTLNLINSLDSSGTADDLRYTGGMLIGYNWQYSGFVLGAEADFNYIGFNGSIRNDVSDTMTQLLTPSSSSASEKISYTADWFGTVRARLGYAMDNVLVYGTGGVAYGQMKIKQQLAAAYQQESVDWHSSTDGWKAGWTLGGGMEYASGRWLLGAEYLYVNLGTYNWGSMGDVTLDDDEAGPDWQQVKEKGKADFNFSVARATLKYRF